MSLRIALFAAEWVGREVTDFMAHSTNPPVALVVDSRDRMALDREIVACSRLTADAIFSSEDLKTAEGLDRLRARNLDLGILAWWPYIIREPLMTVPKLGLLNFHPSHLPHNRGKNYNFWALVEQAPFGVTLHWVTERIDSGDIAFQKRIPVTWEDSGETLYRKAQTGIVELYKEVYSDISAGHIPRVPQDLKQGSVHVAAELEEASRIDLDGTFTGRDLLNLLRARTFRPHGAAWFRDGGERFEARIEIRRTE